LKVYGRVSLPICDRGKEKGDERQKGGKVLQSSKSPSFLFITWVVKIAEESNLSKKRDDS